jgi:hypothetical protein
MGPQPQEDKHQSCENAPLPSRTVSFHVVVLKLPTISSDDVFLNKSAKCPLAARLCRTRSFLNWTRSNYSWLIAIVANGRITATFAPVHSFDRMATYKYYLMDQVVAQAPTLYNALSDPQMDRSPKTANEFNTFMSAEMGCQSLRQKDGLYAPAHICRV